MLRITNTIAIPEEELSERFIRAGGPGGQNVNKVSSAVQLRFDAAHSPNLPEEVAERALKLAGARATRAGEIIIEAKRFRDQEKNRADARARLVTLLQRAAHPPRPRKKTRPPKSAEERRLADKRRRAARKDLRAKVRADE